MAKLTNAKTIMENVTGNVLFISVHSFSRTFQIGVKILKDDSKDKILGSIALKFYAFQIV